MVMETTKTQDDTFRHYVCGECFNGECSHNTPAQALKCADDNQMLTTVFCEIFRPGGKIEYRTWVYERWVPGGKWTRIRETW